MAQVKVAYVRRRLRKTLEPLRQDMTRIMGELRSFYAATSTPKTTPEGMSTTCDTIMALLPHAVRDARSLKAPLLRDTLELVKNAGFSSAHDARTGLHLASFVKRLEDAIAATFKISMVAHKNVTDSSYGSAATPVEHCAIKLIKHRKKSLYHFDAMADRFKKFCAVFKAHINSEDFAARCMSQTSDIPIHMSDLSGTRAQKREYLRNIAPEIVEAERAEKRAIKALIANDDDDDDDAADGEGDAAVRSYADEELDAEEFDGEDEEPNAIVGDIAGEGYYEEDDDVRSEELSEEESDEEDSLSEVFSDDASDSGGADDGSASSRKEDLEAVEEGHAILAELDDKDTIVRRGRKLRKRTYTKVDLDVYGTMEDQYKVADNDRLADESESEALEQNGGGKKKRARSLAQVADAVARDEAGEMEREARRLATELAESIQNSTVG